MGKSNNTGDTGKLHSRIKSRKLLPIWLIFFFSAVYFIIIKQSFNIPKHQEYAIILFFCMIIIFFITWDFLAYYYQRHLKYFFKALIENADQAVIITNNEGNIIFKNAQFSHYFPQVNSHIKDLVPSLGNKNNQQNLNQFLKSASLEESFDTVIDIIMQDKTIKYFNLSCIKHKYLVLWTFIIEDILKEKYLFHDNRFQRSINPKYLFEHAPATNIILDYNGCLQGYSQNFKKFISDEELSLGDLFTNLLSPACQIDLRHGFLSLLKNQEPTTPIEVEFKEGKTALAYCSKIEFPDLSYKLFHQGYLLQLFDNNEHKKFQQRLLQSQKLQALGQLSGGVAHDFNNLLTVMIGYCDLLLLRHCPGDSVFTELTHIKKNANRATNLVKQLLSFSRQQTIQSVVINVGETLTDLLSMLQRLMGPLIELKVSHEEELYRVKFDQGQFEQVITNLIVNAKDAIQNSGTIHVATSNRHIEHPILIGHETIEAGEYVQIEIIDDGFGIEMKNINRIFDPFFTTKQKGSGLGLSTVYGLIKQARGYIMVESAHKIGTKFIILLPKTDSHEQAIPSVIQPLESLYIPRDLTGTGSILLVDDEDAVRLVVARALSGKGYTIIEASTGQEALAYLKGIKYPGEEPHLLITDIAMPKMDGMKLAKEALALCPQLRIIYTSGYSEESFREQLAQEPIPQFLQKPFDLQTLVTKVREIFDQIELPSVHS